MEGTSSHNKKPLSLEDVTKMITRAYERKKGEKNKKKIFMDIVNGHYEMYFREKSGLTFKRFLSKVRKKMNQLEEEEKIKVELELEGLEKKEQERIQALEDQKRLSAQ